jgi:hypothetical protein
MECTTMSRATDAITASPARDASRSAEQLDELLTRLTWQNERRRRLEAISDPFWVEAVAAELNRHATPKLVHSPVNRDRTAFDGWC